ncbi:MULTISPECIES: hypothetical protein [Streptomyces]|jgi:hypothetical protein|uniref:hypothetical protein n=1 Tax=Streptomyces TaxID=1883 RepID=UPI00034E33EA|nr:hypothetical protein HMPREF1211_03788 [Streptomyces sp. HGB0020]
MGNPVSNFDPAPGYQSYDHPPEYPHHPHRNERRDPGSGTRRAALIIHTIADVAAAFLGLWIVLYLLEANRDNVFVEFVHSVADALAWWSQDIFTMDTEGLRVLLNFGLPALIYLAVGHGISVRLSRA